MLESNRTLVMTWFAEVWDAGDESAIDRMLAPSTKFHGLPTPDGGPVIGPAGFKPFYRAFRAAFPDIRIRVERTICEGDMVAAQCVVSGTHDGEGLGVAATGAKLDIHGVAIARIRDGKIVEGWNHFDFLSLYQTVGLLPALGAPA